MTCVVFNLKNEQCFQCIWIIGKIATKKIDSIEICAHTKNEKKNENTQQRQKWINLNEYCSTYRWCIFHWIVYLIVHHTILFFFVILLEKTTSPRYEQEYCALTQNEHTKIQQKRNTHKKLRENNVFLITNERNFVVLSKWGSMCLCLCVCVVSMDGSLNKNSRDEQPYKINDTRYVE